MAEYRTLYEECFMAMREGEFSVIGEKLTNILDVDPVNGEAWLCLSELRCAQGEAESGLGCIEELLLKEPRNPYYLLARAELLINKSALDGPLLTVRDAEELLRSAYLAADSYDALAKAGLVCCLNGFWSMGLRSFMDAADMISGDAADFVLPGSLGVGVTIEEAGVLHAAGKGRFNDVCFQTIVRVYFLCMVANDAGILEAGLAASALSNKCSALAEAVKTEDRLLELFEGHCKDRWFDDSASALMDQLKPSVAS